MPHAADGGSHAVTVGSRLSDAELVVRCRRGDQAAWRELVERFSRYVYAIATQAYRLNETDAEDVFQEVFARTYQHLDRLRNDEAIRPWIGQLTRRLAIDRLRQRKHEDATEDPPEIAAGDRTMEGLLEALTVRDALATLPPHCQEIMDRFLALDQSYETIGAALDIAPGTIPSRLARCRAKLRDVLAGTEALVAADKGGRQ